MENMILHTESKAAISAGVRPSKRFSMMTSERKISEEPSSRAALANYLSLTEFRLIANGKYL